MEVYGVCSQKSTQFPVYIVSIVSQSRRHFFFVGLLLSPGGRAIQGEGPDSVMLRIIRAGNEEGSPDIVAIRVSPERNKNGLDIKLIPKKMNIFHNYTQHYFLKMFEIRLDFLL